MAVEILPATHKTAAYVRFRHIMSAQPDAPGDSLQRHAHVGEFEIDNPNLITGGSPMTEPPPPSV